MRYFILLICISTLMCTNVNEREANKFLHDAKLESQITDEIDRVCNILGFVRQGDFNFLGYQKLNDYKVYWVEDVNIQIEGNNFKYRAIFRVLDDKILLRSFRYSIPYAETRYNTEVENELKRNIIEAISIFAEQVGVKFYGEPEIYEMHSHYFVEFGTDELIHFDATVTFILTKDIKIVGLYHGA